MKINSESVYSFFSALSLASSLLLKRKEALLNSATQFPSVPRVDMACGVHPIRPIPATTTFLAPLSCSSCHSHYHFHLYVCYVVMLYMNPDI